MISGSRLIQRYIVSAAFPYALLALILLTALIFVQQTARFAEILVSARVPINLFGVVSAAIVPGILVFTLPMSMLAGVVIGFSRLGSDSEMVVIRNAGVSTWSIMWPILCLGLVTFFLSAYVNFELVPKSGPLLRQAGAEAAITKLESPIEPRTFTTDLPGYVAYVKDGDKLTGKWGRVFIYANRKDGTFLAVTARTGRIDSTGDQSELVMTDAVSTQFPASDNDLKKAVVVERTDSLRFSFDTGKKNILSRLEDPNKEIEESDLRELIGAIRAGTPDERSEAMNYFHKRMSLSCAPVLFAFLGVVLGMRIRKGGRAFGILISILVMLFYYLFVLIGEQLGRAGTVPVWLGAWMASGLTLFAGVILLWALRRHGTFRIGGFGLLSRVRKAQIKSSKRATALPRLVLSSFPTLMDSSLLQSLVQAFLVALFTLISIFLLFTLFEQWKFMATSHVGISVVIKYLFFLTPFVFIQLLPASTLISVLFTYALLARRSEIIAWLSAGQSIYRLLIPGLIFSLLAGFAGWYIQERVAPSTNIRQDAIRAQIRGDQARAMTKAGRQWLASVDSQRLYSYEYIDRPNSVSGLTIFDFDASGTHLTKVTRADSATWTGERDVQLNGTAVFELSNPVVNYQTYPSYAVALEPFSLFKPTIDKPSQLNARELSSYINLSKKRGVDVGALVVALYRKYSDPFGAVIMMLLGAPLALSFGRRNVVAGLCIAILVGVTFWGVASGFQQLGTLGLLPGAVAAFAPVAIFGSAGLYFLARTRT